MLQPTAGRLGSLGRLFQGTQQAERALQQHKHGVRMVALALYCIQGVKTLVPLKDVDTLDSLQPDFARIESVCSTISSTGVYPYAVVDQAKQIFAARQFPKACILTLQSTADRLGSLGVLSQGTQLAEKDQQQHNGMAEASHA